MPRKAKRTAGGYAAQPATPVAGQRYGEAVKQHDLMAQMPTPNVQAGVGALPQSPVQQAVAQAQPQPQGQQQAASPEQLSQIAAAMRSQTGLFDQTSRPGEPVTAGLPVGPGAGPEAMNMRRGSPVAATIAELARLTGDGWLAELAQRSGF